MSGAPAHRLRDAVAPVGVQILTLPYPQFRLHFQPVRGHAVKGLQDAVKARQNPKMLLNVRKCLFREYTGSHVLILDALIGQHRRSQPVM